MPRGPRAALSWFSTLQYATTTPIQVLALGVPESPELGLLGCARARLRARPRVGGPAPFSECRGSIDGWGSIVCQALPTLPFAPSHPRSPHYPELAASESGSRPEDATMLHLGDTALDHAAARVSWRDAHAGRDWRCGRGCVGLLSPNARAPRKQRSMPTGVRQRKNSGGDRRGRVSRRRHQKLSCWPLQPVSLRHAEGSGQPRFLD